MPSSCCNLLPPLRLQVVPTGGLTKLKDMRPLPASLPSPAAVFQEEGETYYWLFRTHMNVLLYTSCVDEPGAELALPPGWRVHALGNLTQAQGPPLPAVYVLHNQETNQLLFMVGGGGWGGVGVVGASGVV